MAEDTGGNTALIAGLSTDDITPSVYEGGLKTWECSVDLARCLLNEYGNEEGLRGEDVHVIEVRSLYCNYPFPVWFGCCLSVQ